jgi:hypothetical protein
MTMTDGALVLYDYITLYKVQDGSSDVVSLLTNEYHTVVALLDDSSVEIEQKLKQALSYVKVYQGFTDITDQYTFTKTDSSDIKSVFYPSAKQIQVIAMNQDTGSITLTGTHSTLATQTKTMSLVKSKRGTTIGV